MNRVSSSPLTLVVLAAGWGQRFGGMKQMARVGPVGQYLLDYAMYDAARAGFDRVVFVLRESIRHDFEQDFMRPLRTHLLLDHVLQGLDDLPPGFTLPPGRTKPWGTLHALWSARHAVKHPFALINADDFYGAPAFQAVADFLRSAPVTAKGQLQGCMAGYDMSRTLTEHGGVNRGLCDIQDGLLRTVREYTQIARDAQGVIRGLNPDGEPEVLSPHACVSMNLWAWNSDIFASVEAYLNRFFSTRIGDPLAEAYVPSWWDEVLHKGQGVCQVLPSTAQWAGLTYPQDQAHVKAHLTDLTKQGHYPEDLWAQPLFIQG